MTSEQAHGTAAPAVKPRATTGRLRATWKQVAIGVLIGLYALATVAVWGLFYFAGDRWWLATVMLFGPRWIYAAPLPVLAVLAGLYYRRALIPLAILTAVQLFAIMGLELHWSSATQSPRALRIVSLNTNRMRLDEQALLTWIDEIKPDVVVLQEYPHPGTSRAKEIVWPEGWHVSHYDEYFLASRLPIVDVEHALRPGSGSVAAVAYTLERDGKKLRLVSVHLSTPRNGLEAVLDRKTLLAPSHADKLDRIIRYRRLESNEVSQWTARSTPPVIVAGDFNMPRDSAIFRNDWSSRFSNAYSQSGCGFGSTKLTAKWGWTSGLRIDHILFDEGWHARRCWVGPDLGSDHLPIVAELEPSLP